MATTLVLTALSVTESEKVFHFVRQAKEGCASALFISHTIYHTYDIPTDL